MPLRFPNFRQHVKNRSMWKGSMCIDDTKYWKMTDKVTHEATNMCSEALLKCLDEIIINAADQIVRTVENKLRSTTLEVRFDSATGEILVYNDGPGFEIYDDHEELPKGVWTVQALITTERAGTNFDDMYGAAGTADESVTGGVNGLGIKLIVIDSVKFTIETVDNERNRYYYQEIYNGMENPDDIKPPIVIDLGTPNKLTPQQKKPHTTIRFIPDYNNLCRASENAPNKKTFTSVDFTEFEKIVKFRTYQLSAFLTSLAYRYANVGRVEYKNVNVYYNSVKINATCEDIIKLLGVEYCGSTLIASEDDEIRFPWKIVVGIKKDGDFPVRWGDAKNTNMSFLNGVYLSDGGSHINYLNKQIFDYIIKKSKKADAEKITKNMVDKIIYIVDSIQIPKRLISFKSQSKTQVTIGTADLNAFKKKYVLSEEFLAKITKKIKQELAVLIDDKNANESTKTTNTVKLRKYEPGTKIHDKKYFGKRILALPEGDSANKTVTDVIIDRGLKDYIGTYNLQGVPPNALKHIKRVARGGIEHLIKDKMLRDNITFNGLMKILKLEYGMQNIDTRRLNYDSVLLCTDQDSDGIGQICSLTLVFFLVFFPELVQNGFVKRLATPLIRVYTNNKNSEVLKFYREKDYSIWAHNEFGGTNEIPKSYEVKYYKGLATHTPDEVINDIGANFEENVYTYTYDDAAQALLELAYGEDTYNRKEFLRSPVIDDYDENLYAKQIIKCSQQFSIEAKSYQLEFIQRKLKSAIDGFIPVQRKAFAGGRKSSQKHKVYQITGKVTESLSYHHGDKSMNDTIIKMAQNFTGGSNIPLFMPISNGFGDRRTGRDDTGSARYLDTKLNTDIANAMFPPEDDWLLDYVFEDGQQAEPVFYVPVLPISILETTTTPAVGWKIDCWARDPRKVIENVRTMIEIDWDATSAFKPGGLLGNPWLKPGMRCVVDQYGKSSKAFTEICLGDYIIDDDTVKINQLPLRVWSTTFKENLLGEDETKRKKYVQNVVDNTGNDINDIQIILEPGAVAKIMEEIPETKYIDPIETYFEIKQQMHMNLNMLNNDGCVTEFKTYEEILKYWYPFRKNLYIERIERNKIILKIKIDYWKNTLRFINEDANKTINIDKDFTEEQRYTILEGANYTKFNETLLFSPKYTKASELEKLIYNTGNYKYIDKITIKNKSMKGIAKIVEIIKKLESEYEEILNTKWQNVWLSEIDKLEKIIEKGIETKWLFGTKQFKYIKAEKSVKTGKTKK